MLALFLRSYAIISASKLFVVGGGSPACVKNSLMLSLLFQNISFREVHTDISEFRKFLESLC